MRRLFTSVILTLILSVSYANDRQIRQIMKRSTQYMMDVVSYNGGFVWSYLPDFSRQWGELEAKRTMAWTQAPGTPEMGQIMLDAYHATGDEYYYECAKKVANALVWGQLPCGGWNYVFDYAGEASLREWYATTAKAAWRMEEFQHYYGNATFDDGATIGCATFLLRLYLEKQDPTYRVPLEKAIHLLLESQYPNGGWPQRYPLKYDHSVDGNADYTSFITINDNVQTDNIMFLLKCYQMLGMENLKEPILRGMYLCITLQQGEPYAGWADQYSVDELKPMHARSYEPRGIGLRATWNMIHDLSEFYKLTGDTRFLSGIPAAIDFIESQKLPLSVIPKNEEKPKEPDEVFVPRFIDPETGTPLYMHRKGSNIKNGRYYISQDIENTIGHYSSTCIFNVKNLKDELIKLKSIPREKILAQSPFVQKEAVSFPKIFCHPTKLNNNENMTLEEIVNKITKEGYWLTKLQEMSYPYKPTPDDMPESNDTMFSCTDCGDEYDTSPFPNFTDKDGVMGISTAVFINNMSIMIEELMKESE